MSPETEDMIIMSGKQIIKATNLVSRPGHKPERNKSNIPYFIQGIPENGSVTGLRLMQKSGSICFEEIFRSKHHA